MSSRYEGESDEYNSDGDEGLPPKVCDESKKSVCKNGPLEDQ